MSQKTTFVSSIRLIVLLSFILAFSCLLFFSFYTYNNHEHTLRISSENKSTLNVLNSVEHLFNDMQSLESGYGGYLVTGKKSYLEPYYTGMAEYQAYLDSLEQPLVTDTAEQYDISQLQRLTLQKVGLAKSLVESYTRGQENVAGAGMLEQGKKIMDSIRISTSLIERRERARLHKWDEMSTRTALQMFDIFLFSSVVLGLFLLFFYIIIDSALTRRKKAEQLNRYHSILLQNISDAVVATDSSFKITSWNSIAETLYGWVAHEAMGKNIEELLNIQYPFDTRAETLKAYQEKGFWSGEEIHYKKNGERIDVFLSATLIRNESGDDQGMVAVIRDVTLQKKAAAQLKQFNEDLAKQVEEKTTEIKSVFARVSDAFVALDTNWRCTYINSKAERLFNSSPGALIGKQVWTAVPETIGHHIYKVCEEAMQSQQYQYLEEYFTAYGLYFEIHIYPSPNGVSVYLMDITERKKAEQKISKTNRLYAVISQVNQAIVHIKSVDELFKKVCSIAISYGKFRMVWIGLMNTESTSVIPVEYAGHEDGYLSGNTINIDETRGPVGPAGKAIQQGGRYICNDIENDPVMSTRRHEALLRGYRSCMALTITKFNKPVGTFALYAAEDHFFDQQEIDLLDEVVRDISFALEFFEKEGLRRKTEKEIFEEKLFSESIINSLPGIFYLYDDKLRFLRWNRLLEEISGYSHDEISRMSPLDFFAIDQKNAVKERIDEVFADGASQIEAAFFTKDGRKIPFYFTGIKIEFKGSACLIGIGIDISKLKETEYLLKKSEDNYRRAQAIGRMGHWEHNIANNQIEWSDEVYQIFGMDHRGDKISYETFFNSIHPEDRDFFAAAFKNTLSAKTRLEIIHRIILKNGEIRYVHEMGEMVLDKDGNVTGLTGTVQDITEQEIKELEIQEMNGQLRALAANLQNIREEERTNISREIHDDLGQQLTAIKMDVSWVGKKIHDDSGVKQKVDNIIVMLNNCIQSIRRISTQLRPSVLDDLGLVDALQWQIEEFQKRYTIEVYATWPDETLTLDPGKTIGLFRVFQEALTNIARHAQAKSVTTRLFVEGGQLVLSITDNGKGFEKDVVKAKKTLGLLGMKERTLMMGGHCEIDSKPGEGTTIKVSVPLDVLSFA